MSEEKTRPDLKIVSIDRSKIQDPTLSSADKVKAAIKADIAASEEEQQVLTLSVDEQLSYGVLALAEHEHKLKKRIDVKLPTKQILPLGEILMRAGRKILELEQALETKRAASPLIKLF